MQPEMLTDATPVSAVLGKLGAPTRQAAASHAARLGLASAAEI